MLAWAAVFLATAPQLKASVADAISEAAPHGPRGYRPGEAIVKFDPDTSPEERSDARQAAGVAFESQLNLRRAQVVEVEGGVEAAVRRLERQPGVAYAQPNYRYEALAVPLPPNDTFFENLWGLSDPALPEPGVGALEAWQASEGNGQVIAIADTGVDLTHPDIAGNLWTNPDPDPKANDLHGYDFVDGDGDPDDYNFHGTHVAGTAAAIANNNKGIAGVAPKAEIMAVRVLDGDGSGSTDDIASGIIYAASHGADVVNLSLGGPAGGDEAMSEAVTVAGLKGTVIVAAAGNEKNNNDVAPTTPCTLPQSNLICVAALNKSGSLAGFSNFGATSVDIAAPGTSIVSSKPDYGPPLFENGFEPGETALWGVATFNGGIEWGISSSAASGLQSATDSPGGDYGKAIVPEEYAVSELVTDDPVDLTGERGCRIHFKTMYETEPFYDFFIPGAIDEASGFDVRFLDGTSRRYPTAFDGEEVSISDLDDEDDVHPFFALISDESEQFDGAYVDDVRLICRDETYDDAITPVSEYDLPGAGSYVEFQGTSMATPHVAGVAALVGAAAPEATAFQIVKAILDGASAMPNDDPSRPIATHGIADACQAIALATGNPVDAGCPASTENVIPPQPPPPEPTPQAPIAPPLPIPPPALDTTAPNTFFRQHPAKVVRTGNRRARAVFRFGSNEENVTFLCKVDGGLQRFCMERLVRFFRLGRHVVRVQARDAAGNTDPTPAVFRFRVERVG